jgi:hypothetical protein
MIKKEPKVFTAFYSFCSFLAFIILFSLSSTSLACEITIKNDTGLKIRIASLADMCGNIIVNDRAPHYLKPDEEICFKNLKPVMHHYLISTNGIGTISSVGMDSKTKKYMIRVIRDGLYIWGIITPKIWPGNTKCDEKLDKRIQIWASNNQHTDNIE